MTAELANRAARSAVLQLLSEEEMAKVNDPNPVRKLSAGEEYLDLEDPIQGVQRLGESRLPTGRILPRRAVDGHTWQRILDVIGPSIARTLQG